MNKQEIFNTVVGHLIKQNKQSANVNGTCLYRGPNNTKCAFGILIPDEVYKPYMEGSTSTSILVNQSKQNEIEEPLGISPDDYMFVRHLQRCHDNALTGKDLHLSLTTLGNRHRLDISILNSSNFPKIWSIPR